MKGVERLETALDRNQDLVNERYGLISTVDFVTGALTSSCPNSFLFTFRSTLSYMKQSRVPGVVVEDRSILQRAT